MKIRKHPELIMRTIAGETVLIPTGDLTQKFNGIINLNGVAAFIWEKMEEIESREEMVQLILDRYEIDEETARKDVNGFLDTAIHVGYAREEE